MEEATHLACLIVVLESAARLTAYAYEGAGAYETGQCALFVASYCLCIGAILLNLKDMALFQTPFIKGLIKILHALDGVNALLIGAGMYYQKLLLLAVGLVFMTKVFLLYLLSRMVTGVKTYSTASLVLQTTKTFLHHIGSFMFIASSGRNVILITALWRFISMNGHAAMTLRGQISPQLYDRVMWIICHLRNTALVTVLLLCIVYTDIRQGFAYSASGHIAYMLVRLGPVFRIGSLYFPDDADLKRWAQLNDAQRLQELLQGQHPYFALELGILASAVLYFAYLRMALVFRSAVLTH